MKKFSSLSITSQLSALLTGAIVLSLMITGGILTYISFRDQSDQLKNTQLARAQAVSEKINSYFDDLQRKLTFLARVRGLTTFDAAAQRNILEGLIHHNNAYEMVGITDNKGHLLQVISRKDETAPQEWGGTAVFRRAFQEEEDYFGPVELAPQHTLPTLILAVPIRDEQNKVDGMLFARINLKFLWAILNETKVGENGYVYILNQQQWVIAQSGDIPEQLALEDISQNPLGKLLADKNVPQTYRGLRGAMVLGNMDNITSANWHLVVELPINEAYAPLYNLFRVMGIGLILGILIFGALGVSLSKHVTQSLGKLTRAATQFSHGELETRVVIDQDNELKVLADAFNHMAAQLNDTIDQLHLELAERKRAEEALGYSESFMDSIIEHSANSLWISDEHGTLLRMNQACRDILHLRDEEVVGKYNIFNDNIVEAQGLMPLVRDVFEKGVATHFTIQYDTAAVKGLELEQTASFYLDVYILPILDLHGKVINAIIQHVDITERKLAEEALRESEQRFKLSMDATRDGLWDWNVETDKGYFSPSYYGMLGYEVGAFPEEGGAWMDLIHPDDRERVLQANMDCIEGRCELFEVEYRMKARNGEWRWILGRGKCIARNEQGRAIRLLGTHVDITERNRADAALRESEQIFSTVFHSSPMLIVISRISDNQILKANQFILDTLGLSADEIIGKTSDELGILADPKERALALKKFKTTGSLKNIETHLQKKDGTQVTVLSSTELIKIGEEPCLLTTAIDITERNQAEIRLRRFWDLPLVGMAITLPNRHFLEVNQKLADMFGYTKEELAVMTWVEISHPDDVAENIRLLEQTLAGETDEYTLDKRFIRRDGTLVYTHIAARCIRRADGTVDHLALIVQDITGRKQADEALKKSEARYRLLVEGAPDIIYTFSSKRGGIYYSPRVEEVLGYSAEHLYAHPMLWNESIHPDDRIRINEDIREIETGKFFDIEYRIKDAQGNWHWMRDRSIGHNNIGDESLIEGVATDITGHKQAEDQLRQAEAKYRDIFENAIEGIFQSTPDGHFLNVNAAMARIFGYDNPEEMITSIGNEIATRIYVDPDFRVEFTRILEQAGIVNDFEMENRCKDGSIIWTKTSARSIRDANNVVLYYEGFLEDITRRRQAETALRSSEALLNTSQQLSKVGGWEWDIETQSMFWTDETYHIHGLIPDEITPGSTEHVEKSTACYDPQDRPIILNVFQRCIEQGESYDLEVPFTNVTGRRMWIRTTGSAVWDKERIVKVIGNIMDITERKQAEEEIRQLNSSLEKRIEERTQELRDVQEKLIRQEKLAVLGQMAGSVGHELRNPLGVISSAVYYLKMVQPDANEKIKEYLDIIEREIGNSDKIVADLLDFTRVKSVNHEPASVSELIRQTLERFPAPKSVQVNLDLPADLPQVYADPRQVVQILGNLVLNAYQAMITTGSINGVSTGPATGMHRKRLTLQARARDDMMNISIKDTGMGISRENMKKLFEPLFTTKTKGIGLGLAVSMKLLEANGGRIEVQSEMGAGSTFSIYIPIRKEEK